jgi:hypothetical protein
MRIRTPLRHASTDERTFAVCGVPCVGPFERIRPVNISQEKWEETPVICLARQQQTTLPSTSGTDTARGDKLHSRDGIEAEAVEQGSKRVDPRDAGATRARTCM